MDFGDRSVGVHIVVQHIAGSGSSGIGSDRARVVDSGCQRSRPRRDLVDRGFNLPGAILQVPVAT